MQHQDCTDIKVHVSARVRDWVMALYSGEGGRGVGSKDYRRTDARERFVLFIFELSNL